MQNILEIIPNREVNKFKLVKNDFKLVQLDKKLGVTSLTLIHPEYDGRLFSVVHFQRLGRQRTKSHSC